MELPREIYQALLQVVDTVHRGLAVTISPVTTMLSTQQAADLLGLSRPTVIKLLDEGKIPFERVSSHRRIALPHVLEYRNQRRKQQYALLEELSTDIDSDLPLDEMLTTLRENRRALGARRRPSTDAP
ncbi:DNA-binding protein [Mycetocola tolaasinivorans]|uniref:DNA-binding protein n=1 Tax=Mycetocola tolaasinivorans TaxID=76635 RepID=A0A3L7ACM8_9MICO|nr:helix-turn-helix domain-containing protein [Mycetocola tolaasinivorans]RLP78113.1 DNA-binding protein [Mycetocola tolaasinivorans]